VVELDALQADAEAAARRCLAGALILNEHGRVFVHRRGWNRRLLPGCWDIVGGHVEPGETLLEALAREVTEETGWVLSGEPTLAYVADWETTGESRDGRRREVDFVVEVTGDLGRPRLERPEHVESRWLGSGELDLLDQNRGADGGMVRRLAELALRYARPGRLRYPHATAFLDATTAAPVEELRAAWDPAMAAQIAAHVTVLYPDEIAALEDLDRRLARAAAAVPPFRLRLDRIVGDEPAFSWVYIAVDDLDGGWAQLRELVLGPTTSVALRPHVTLVHPRTTNRGSAARNALEGRRFGTSFTVRELSVTAFDGRRWQAIRRVPLGCRAPFPARRLRVPSARTG
jgi:8-oxo-dGTP diphosphatase